MNAWALEASDAAASLTEVLHAYTALEKLVDPAVLTDSDAVQPTRTELSALLRVINQAFRDRAASLAATTDSLSEALAHCPDIAP